MLRIGIITQNGCSLLILHRKASVCFRRSDILSCNYWITAFLWWKEQVGCGDHMGHCSYELIELPSKRIKISPERLSPHSNHKPRIVLYNMHDQSRYSPKRSKGNRCTPNHYKGKKGGPQKQNNRRKQLLLNKVDTHQNDPKVIDVHQNITKKRRVL